MGVKKVLSELSNGLKRHTPYSCPKCGEPIYVDKTISSYDEESIIRGDTSVISNSMQRLKRQEAQRASKKH